MTPAQAHSGVFDAPEHTQPERPETIIDESPIVAHELPTNQFPHQSQPQSYSQPPQPSAVYAASPAPTYSTMPSQSPYPHERKASQQSASVTSPPPIQAIHPAHFAPYAEPVQQYGHLTQPVALSPVSQASYSQHPSYAYSAVSPVSTQPEPYPQERKTSFPHPDPLQFQAPFQAPAVPRSPTIPAYTPGSPLGPNSSTFHLSHVPTQTHQPPQVETSKSWHASTLAPSGSCFAALFCPCMVYGKAQYRLAQRSKKAEPTDLLGYSVCNSDCVIMSLACGLQGLLAAIQRKRVRRAYDIEGDVCSDCLRGCCCCCCAIGLNESEIVKREEDRRRLAVPSSTSAGYVSTGRLTYMPPPR